MTCYLSGVCCIHLYTLPFDSSKHHKTRHVAHLFFTANICKRAVCARGNSRIFVECSSQLLAYTCCSSTQCVQDYEDLRNVIFERQDVLLHSKQVILESFDFRNQSVVSCKHFRFTFPKKFIYSRQHPHSNTDFIETQQKRFMCVQACHNLNTNTRSLPNKRQHTDSASNAAMESCKQLPQAFDSLNTTIDTNTIRFEFFVFDFPLE